VTAECEIRNRGTTVAHRLGPDGQPLEAVDPGELLYRGPAMLAAASTIPYYGYGVRMFPFAGLAPGQMHLRVGVVKPLSVVANLTRLWRGEWFPAGVQDFLASAVDIRFDRAVPFQVAGDAAGPRTEVTLAVGPERVSLVDFSEAPALSA
jgi:diacylglycerol kinase family enzyme